MKYTVSVQAVLHFEVDTHSSGHARHFAELVLVRDPSFSVSQLTEMFENQNVEVGPSALVQVDPEDEED